MPSCFVIQPFDKGKFDKRFRETFKPAIEQCKLEAYRVDQDPSVNVVIESIQKQIQESIVCLADITTDNPNVWYELGYATAIGRQVVMVCAVNEREGKKYPFDIAHRLITEYRADSKSDWDDLHDKIVKRIEAILKSEAVLDQVTKKDNIAPVDGLTQHELIVLATIVGRIVEPNASYSVWQIKQAAESAGLTDTGSMVGLKKLHSRGFLQFSEEKDYEAQEDYTALKLTDSAWEWIFRNEDKFTLKKDSTSSATSDYVETPKTIPF